MILTIALLALFLLALVRVKTGRGRVSASRLILRAFAALWSEDRVDRNRQRTRSHARSR